MRSLMSVSCVAFALMTIPATAGAADQSQIARAVALKTMQMQDRDHDGRISLKESAGAALTLFGTIDTDGSQLISSNEMLETALNDAAALKVSDDSGQTTAMVQARFQIMDIDGDGSISLPEMLAVTEAVFQTADQNADGYVSEDELIGLASKQRGAEEAR